jgi:LysM repeat protein
MKTRFTTVIPGTLCLAVALTAGGCNTLLEPRSRVSDRERQAAERANLVARLERLENRIASAEEVQQKQMDDTLRGQTEVRRDHDLLRQRIAALEQKAAEIERARAEDRQTIVTLIKTAAQPQTVVQQGREHTVAQGETLSEIAKAYGVTVDAIVRANKLRNAHTIRIGQKLFIPE